MSDLLTKPAGELARLVRDRELTARELTEASLARIEAVDGEINAFMHVDADGALAAADAVEPGDPRPFAGVPIAIKDTAAVAGMPFTFGSELFGDFVPAHDAFVVRRLREAGFVIVGKTSMPEFGILPVTEPVRYGPTRNPWDLERTPGGSSGGGAAAVAAGMVPLAHGSDGGGSIRIPAACCGLVGLKPTRGRVSRGPELGDDMLVQDGSLTRTVAETAQVLDLLAGYETGDATWAPPPAEPFAVAAAREPGKLRIGLVSEPGLDTAVDAIAERGLRDAAELLSALGHDVEPIANPPWNSQELLPVFTLAFGASIAMGIFFAGQITGREPSADLMEPLSWAVYNIVRERTALEYRLAITQLQAASRASIALWDDYDVVLTPALAQRPVRIGEIDSTSANPLEDFARSGHFTPYTALFNVSGQPAISLPLYHGEDGLPVGVQAIGAPAREDVLLSLGAQLEAAQPWADRRPEPAAA
jgi:amidase